MGYGAYTKFYRNAVSVDSNKCLACGKCIDACQIKGVLAFRDGKVILERSDRCMGCLLCVRASPVKAIGFSSAFHYF